MGPQAGEKTSEGRIRGAPSAGGAGRGTRLGGGAAGRDHRRDPCTHCWGDGGPANSSRRSGRPSGSSELPKEGRPPSEVRVGFLFFLLIFCFSLSSDLLYLFSRKQKAAPVALAPLKAVKRGAQSTPGSARPKTPPPLNREEGELPHVEEGREAGQRTPDPPTEEGRTPRPQEAEETVVASEAVPPTGDVSQGGHDHQAERGLTEGTLGVVAVERPHGKAPARPEAPAREGGGRMVRGQDPVIWPNPDDPEGRARFVLDDPSESYL